MRGLECMGEPARGWLFLRGDGSIGEAKIEAFRYNSLCNGLWGVWGLLPKGEVNSLGTRGSLNYL